MNPTDLIYPVLTILYMLLEYWLGKTDKVKPGSVLEMILLLVKSVIKKELPPKP